MDFQIPDDPPSEVQGRPYRFRCQSCGQTTHLAARSPAKCEQCGSLEGFYMPEAGMHRRTGRGRDQTP